MLDLPAALDSTRRRAVLSNQRSVLIISQPCQCAMRKPIGATVQRRSTSMGACSIMKRILFVILALLSFAPTGTAVQADGAWLDRDPPVQWNGLGASLPTVMAQDEMSFGGRHCSDFSRPAETPEDRAVEGAGWFLVNGYVSGWGIRVVAGTSGYDGMCRHAGYQYFVFVDGVFAGTVSPELMSSRLDGAAGATWLPGADLLNVEFVRYAPTDPFCCPSGRSLAIYRIDRTAAGPVVRVSLVQTYQVSAP